MKKVFKDGSGGGIQQHSLHSILMFRMSRCMLLERVELCLVPVPVKLLSNSAGGCGHFGNGPQSKMQRDMTMPCFSML